MRHHQSTCKSIISVFVILLTYAVSTIEADFGGVAVCYDYMQTESTTPTTTAAAAAEEEEAAAITTPSKSYCLTQDTLADSPEDALVAAVSDKIMAPQFFCGRTLDVVDVNGGRQTVVKVIDIYSNSNTTHSNVGDLLLSKAAYEQLIGSSAPNGTAAGAPVPITWSLT